MKIRKRISKSFAWLLSCSMVMVNITPAFAATQYTDSTHAVENQTITNTDGAQQTTVYAELGSEFKVTIPKKVTLDGETKTGKYQVSVEGDIAGLETINVVPEETVSLTTKDKLSVTGSIEQDKIQWTYSEMLESNKVLGNGLISAQGITAGAWNGAFNFNIELKNCNINVTAKNETGENLNASATYITGEKKDNLLNGLVEEGFVESVDDVDALINVESDDFEGIADTTFDVSDTYSEGDTIVILHFDETKQEWEYIGTETVDENGLIKGDFTSYSPVAFVKVTDDKLESFHEHSYTVSIDKESSCTETGIKTYTCRCGDFYQENIDFKEHNWNTDYTIDKEATCTEDGQKSIHCKDCTAVKDNTAIPATGHTEVNGGTADVHTKCSVCNETLSTEHEYTKTISTAATCTTKGTSKYTCDCGYSYEAQDIEINTSSHTGNVENGGTADVHTKYSCCGATISDKHSYTTSVTKEATCTKTGTKKYTCECGYSYTEDIASLGHDYATEYTIDKEATCTVDGSKSQHCSRCESVQNVTTIPATGHSYTSSITKETTCTEAGNRHYDCKNCDYAYNEAIAAKGHTYDATKYVTDTAPTCTKAGSKSVHCNICNAIITSTVTSIPATGHSYGTQTYTWSGVTTCTAKRTCSSCSAEQTESATITNAVTKAATCTATGVRTYTAKFTNTAFATQTKTESIPATGHSCTSSITKEATCTETGTKKYTCECGYTYTEEISALGHNYATKYTIDKAPTCTTDGQKSIHCTRCTATTNVTLIPAQHTTKDGKCTICGEIIAGLYDTNNNLLCSFENSGIDIKINYSDETSNEYYFSKAETSGFNVLKNKYSNTAIVVIPKNTTSIGNCAFICCNNLQKVIIQEGTTSIGYAVFYSCPKLTTVTLPNSVTDIGESAFGYCTSLTDINLPNSITSIKDGTFSNCTSLKNISIPKGVTSIGFGAFADCSSLTSITIPNTVTSIDDAAFMNCEELTTITLPNSVVTIGDRAFKGNYSLTNVTIPEGVASIGEHAFYGCSELTNITIPDSVTTIGDYAFCNCYYLKSITWKGKTYTDQAEFNKAVKAAGIADKNIWSRYY